MTYSIEQVEISPSCKAWIQRPNFSRRLRKTGLSLLMIKPAEKSGSNVRCEPAIRGADEFISLLGLQPASNTWWNAEQSKYLLAGLSQRVKWPLESPVLRLRNVLSRQFWSRPGRKIKPWGRQQKVCCGWTLYWSICHLSTEMWHVNPRGLMPPLSP